MQPSTPSARTTYWHPCRWAALFSLFSLFAFFGEGNYSFLFFLAFLLFLLPVPTNRRTPP